MFRSLNRLSVFWRVLLLFIALMIPMYLSSIYITFKGREGIQSEILKSAESKGNFYMIQLETQLYNVTRLHINILNDKNIRTLQRTDINISLAESFSMLNSIRNMLKETANMSSYIKEIAVFLPVVGKKVTTQSITPLDNQEYNTYLKNSSVENLPFCYIDGDYYINMTPEFSDKSMPLVNDTHPFVVSTCISKEAVQTSIKDIAGVDGGGAFLVSDGKGLDLLASNNDRLRVELEEILPALTSQGKKSYNIQVKGMRYHVFLNPSSFLHTVLVTYIPENSFIGTLRIFSSWIWIMSILMLLLVSVFSFWIKGMIIRPLTRLIEALKHVEDGIDDVKVNYENDDEFGHIYSRFNYLVDRLKHLVADIYKKELMLKEAEFKQLQYQINPHFLYNSLLVVNGLIKLGEIDGALKLTSHLSSYYHYVTKELPEEVELIKEVNHVKDYCQIQNIRFQDRIVSEFEEIPEHMKEFSVPRLILQPIVENVYKHGLKNKIKNGRMRLSSDDSEEYFKIIVADNGDELDDKMLENLKNEINKDDSKELPVTGIKNVHNRLRIRFKGESGVMVDRSTMGGLQVTLSIYKGKGDQFYV